MFISDLALTTFTVFQNARFEFCRGVNVFLGPNGTGKTHILKLLYALTLERDGASGLEVNRRDLMQDLVDVFRPANRNGGRLVRLADSPPGYARVHLAVEHSGREVRLTLPIYCDIRDGNNWRTGGDQLFEFHGVTNFIPCQDVLASFPGLAALWTKREVAVDKTHYNLCRNLELPRLKDLSNGFGDLVRELEGRIGGRLFLKDGQFFVEMGDDAIEAPLMPEGHRRLATILQLCANGSIAKDTVLFWDEPEANLNPVLISKTAEIIRRLASLGVQVFLTSHDYLLTSELSTAAEYGLEPQVPIRFFGLSGDARSGVTVRSGANLVELPDNPIVSEYAAQYEREQRLFKIAHNW